MDLCIIMYSNYLRWIRCSIRNRQPVMPSKPAQMSWKPCKDTFWADQLIQAASDVRSKKIATSCRNLIIQTHCHELRRTQNPYSPSLYCLFHEIGRASWRERVVRTCRYRWSP